jgi:hypothetical protein
VPTTPALYFNAFKRDVRYCRSGAVPLTRETAISCRSSIVEFSAKSAASLSHVCRNSGHHIKTQFCLTYGEAWPIDGKAAKKQLGNWLKVVRRQYPEVHYLWVLEFQTKREGMPPHFHVWLDFEKTKAIHEHLAEAWVRITKGGEKQSLVHRHHTNFKKWDMQNGDYAVKYAEKACQKDVPAWFKSVARFWGCSYNMIPESELFTCEAITATTAHHPTPWDMASFSRFAHRVFRRFHEKKMNYDKSGQRRKSKTGQVHKWRKSTVIRQSSGELIDGCFRIPDGRKILKQLMRYIVGHEPDLYSLRASIKARIPF